jgi:hypothetical protein
MPRPADIGFGDAAGSAEWMTRAGPRRCRAFRGAGNGFDRTLHVALDQERKLLAAAVLQLGHHLLERTACRSGASRLVAQPDASRYSVISRARLHSRPQRSGRRPRRALEGREFQPAKTGPRSLTLLAAVVDQGADRPHWSPATTISPGLSVPAEPERWQPNRGPCRAWPRSRCLRRCGRDWPSARAVRPAAGSRRAACRG